MATLLRPYCWMSKPKPPPIPGPADTLGLYPIQLPRSTGAPISFHYRNKTPPGYRVGFGGVWV
jgi:hypothetical protein